MVARAAASVPAAVGFGRAVTGRLLVAATAQEAMARADVHAAALATPLALRAGRARPPRSPIGRGVVVAPGVEAHEEASGDGQSTLPVTPLLPVGLGAVVALPIRDARVASPPARKGGVVTPTALA